MKNYSNPGEILETTKLVEYFTELAQMDTQSNASSEACPSTFKQTIALEQIKFKLIDLGLKDANIDDNGYLFATLDGNSESSKTIGLLAHVDTAPDYSGTNVKPTIHENYDGQPIVLADNVTISASDSPELSKCIGDTIITSDGTTLLGADDKAGIAEILATMQYLQQHPEIKRPTIRVGITPDEEIGRGSSKFDLKKFDADCAYTLDGGFTGEVNFETFSADAAHVLIKGQSVHPGYAKGKLVNALRYASKFVDKLSDYPAPETTELREGFIHPTDIEGSVAKAEILLILRDFETGKLEPQAQYLQKIKEELLKEEPRLEIEIKVTKTYRNMAEKLQDQPQVANNLLTAVKMAGLESKVRAIRGGTDGSGLTEMGLPTPNIFAGGVNFHGPREWISTRSMGYAVCTVLNLLQCWAETK